MLLCSTFVAHAEEEAATFPVADYPPAVVDGVATSLSKSDTLLDRVAEGEQECNQVPITSFIETDGTRITARPVALCAYKESDRSWHVIRLAITYPVPDAYKRCVASAPDVASRRDCSLPYRVLTPDYRVEHVAGYGIARMIFNVSQAVSISSSIARGTCGSTTTRCNPAILRGSSPLRASQLHTLSSRLPRPRRSCSDGRAFLHLRARHALQTLRGKAVPSLAYPDAYVADVVPEETPVAVALIEQSDDKKFSEDPKRTVEAVLIEYALNRHDAFKWSQSGASALGAMQFTGNTYLSVANDMYVSAGLDPQFASEAHAISTTRCAQPSVSSTTK